MSEKIFRQIFLRKISPKYNFNFSGIRVWCRAIVFFLALVLWNKTIFDVAVVTIRHYNGLEGGGKTHVMLLNYSLPLPLPSVICASIDKEVP